MESKKPCLALLALLALALTSAGATQAATAYVKHQNLAEMTDEAAMIYRGKVIGIVEGKKQLAGGELPTVTFNIEILEALKGDYITKGDKRYTELTVAGSFKPVLRQIGEFQQRLVLPDPPGLKIGEEYLLMTNAPNQHGLANTIGLAQGCFHVQGVGKGEIVINGARNAGLFSGMDTPQLAAAGTALSYTDLVNAIRAEMDR